ncbi:MAG: hypothetical protein IPM83_17010 [Ignavibacteria bacterium]|nr:hypothetical protein [Ignavibacteria bacterium]
MDHAYLASCWRAYAGSDPTMIEDLLRQTPPALSHVAIALRAHLERFPNTKTKLGRPQELVEELLARGLTEPEDLVQAFIALDANVYGWGDAADPARASITRILEKQQFDQLHRRCITTNNGPALAVGPVEETTCMVGRIERLSARDHERDGVCPVHP